MEEIRQKIATEIEPKLDGKEIMRLQSKFC